MRHPLIESQPLVEESNNGPNSTAVKHNFIKMTALLAINHGCTVSCLDLANARLGSIGVWQSGILYASYTLSALFGASYFVKRLGSRNGLILGMGMDASYVTSFFLVSLIAEKNVSYEWLHQFVAIVGAIVGGVGSSILWVSQGSYFSCASQLFASKRGSAVEEITSKFGGNFAFALLVIEVLLRLLSSFAIKTAGLSWKVIFGLYSFLSILPVGLMIWVMDLDRYQKRPLETEYSSVDEIVEEEKGSPSHKAAATIDLLRKDPKAKYLSPLSLPILFGLSSSFCSSILNGAVIREVLSDPNSTYVGFYTSTTSCVAAGASLLFGILQSSRGRFRCGKGLFVMVGVLSYLIIALQFIAFPDASDWSRMTLLLLYVLLGVGRAMYEGTLKALFADMFPNEKEGAFGNLILFGGTASTMGFVLSVTGALQCENVSQYCLEYNDGSIHNVLVEELVIIATAMISIPAFWRAAKMYHDEQIPRST